MEVKDLIVPYNSNHSIKEAVIAIFLANRIIKPERFQKLIEHDFKDEFQQFDKIGKVAFRFQHETGQPANITIPEKEEDAGFNFISYDKGEVNKILQARNENDRYFISFHDRKYVSWSDFYQSYIKDINVMTST